MVLDSVAVSSWYTLEIGRKKAAFEVSFSGSRQPGVAAQATAAHRQVREEAGQWKKLQYKPLDVAVSSSSTFKKNERIKTASIWAADTPQATWLIFQTACSQLAATASKFSADVIHIQPLHFKTQMTYLFQINFPRLRQVH